MKGKGANRRPKMNMAAATAMLASMFGNDAMRAPNQRGAFRAAFIRRQGRSRYMPHQGMKEMDRRVRQMKAGIIKP